MTGQTEKWLVITGSLPFLQPSSSCHNKKCPLSMSLGRPMFKHGNLGMDVIIKMTQYYTV